MKKSNLTFQNNSFQLTLENIEFNNSFLYSLLHTKDSKKSIQLEIQKAERDIHLMKGAIICQKKYSKLILLIRQYPLEEDLISELINSFSLSSEQAIFCVNFSIAEFNVVEFDKILAQMNKYIIFLKELLLSFLNKNKFIHYETFNETK